MKKQFKIILLLSFVLFLSSCANQAKDDLSIGLNAVITQIDEKQEMLTVKDNQEDGIFGNHSVIDAKNTPVIYCDYKTGKVIDIDFSDLKTGDEIIVNIRNSELEKLNDDNSEKNLRVEQIQLSTQIK
ncbi:MAG: hypothetical protein E6074_06050 [Anaerococcus sp.]|uniref:hypothetical protein n=1 Tax=Anaerococcus octavius TaxID=54007 RepID=UPI002352B01F|nr:hypothetical protein [Anaerococcus octavius]MDU5535610.1 hypothetical protein [Anaerococcus sp.]